MVLDLAVILLRASHTNEFDLLGQVLWEWPSKSGKMFSSDFLKYMFLHQISSEDVYFD